MKIFYIPDGHRRYAARERISLARSYELGYLALFREVLTPLFSDPAVETVGVFLLSSLNLARRRSAELNELLNALDALVPKLHDEASVFCTVRVFGRRYDVRAPVNAGPPFLDLYLDSDTDDDAPTGEVDWLLRSGGGLRLSGAPRRIIGPHTEMFSTDKLHPDVTRHDVSRFRRSYEDRYTASTDRTDV